MSQRRRTITCWNRQFGDAFNAEGNSSWAHHITVLASSTGMRVSGGDLAYAQKVMANVVFAETLIFGGEQHVNATGVLADAANHLVDAFPRPDDWVLLFRLAS